MKVLKLGVKVLKLRVKVRTQVSTSTKIKNKQIPRFKEHGGSVSSVEKVDGFFREELMRGLEDNSVQI